MTSPENLIKKLPRSSCRKCVNFIRVNVKGQPVYNRQGFCLYGRLVGDWSLYISQSGDCKGYVFSTEHNRITVAEKALQKMEDEFIWKCQDRRTKEYKLIKPMLEATTYYGSKIDNLPGMSEFKAWNKLKKVVKEYFRYEYRETYGEVLRMVPIWKDHYMKFLAQLSVEIHDRYCDCDKLEFVDKSETNLLKESCKVR